MSKEGERRSKSFLPQRTESKKLFLSHSCAIVPDKIRKLNFLFGRRSLCIECNAPGSLMESGIHSQIAEGELLPM